jgi:hypothetical protein
VKVYKDAPVPLLRVHNRHTQTSSPPVYLYKGAAEAAFGFIAAGIAQMARFVGYCSAIFACVSHH